MSLYWIFFKTISFLSIMSFTIQLEGNVLDMMLPSFILKSGKEIHAEWDGFLTPMGLTTLYSSDHTDCILMEDLAELISWRRTGVIKISGHRAKKEVSISYHALLIIESIGGQNFRVFRVNMGKLISPDRDSGSNVIQCFNDLDWISPLWDISNLDNYINLKQLDNTVEFDIYLIGGRSDDEIQLKTFYSPTSGLLDLDTIASLLPILPFTHSAFKIQEIIDVNEQTKIITLRISFRYYVIVAFGDEMKEMQYVFTDLFDAEFNVEELDREESGSIMKELKSSDSWASNRRMYRILKGGSRY